MASSKSIARALQRHTLWLSLLLHALLFVSFTMIWTGFPEREDKKPSMYIPAYTYHEQTMPSAQQVSSVQNKRSEKDGLEKKTQTTAPKTPTTNQAQIKPSKNTEAIHLIGDKKTVPKPLIKLLGKALAQHLVYPKIAVDFRAKGTAYVGFILRPDGLVLNVQLVKSSDVGVLDEEALNAVRAMSPIKDVSLYLSQPKEMVVGIIFN